MDMCKVLCEDLLQREVSFGFETVASREDKLEFAERAKSLGYEIRFLFVTTGDPEICCRRIDQRVAAGGHDVPRLSIVYKISYIIELKDLWKKAEVYNREAKEELKNSVLDTVLSNFKDKTMFETAKSVAEKFDKNDS